LSGHQEMFFLPPCTAGCLLGIGCADRVDKMTSGDLVTWW
jgi:hypothetical protein